MLDFFPSLLWDVGGRRCGASQFLAIEVGTTDTPGGLAEISRGLRQPTQRGDGTPGSGQGVHDLARVAADLASRWDALTFSRRPGVSLPQVAQPPANFSHRSAMPLAR